MSELTFVNYAGEPVSLDPSRHARKREEKLATPFHKGWRVVGLKPGELEEARKAKGSGFDEEVWARRAKKSSVRSRPYEIYDAAAQCLLLAERGGWTHLSIVEVSRS